MRQLRLALLALMLVPGPAAAATLSDAGVGFSADRLLVINGHRYLGKIWAMPGKERHEQTIEGFQPIFLLRADSPIGKVVLAKLKTIVEFVTPPELRLLGGPDVRKDPVGHDMVNGVATTKYAVDESMPEGHAQGTLWLSRDGIPMKLAGIFTGHKGKPAKIGWELSHVRIGRQPAALFEAPRGYAKLPPEAVEPLLGLRLKSAKSR